MLGRRPLLSLAKTLISNSKFPSLFPSSNSFSTSTLQHKSPFESNLIRMLANQIQYESEYTPPHQAEKKFNAFTVEGRPGEQFVTLRGSGIDENIKIEATMFDGVDGDDDNAQLHISVVVDILKGEGGEMLEFVCSAWPNRLEIQKLYVIRPDAQTLSQPYTGPDFRVLDKKVQSSIYEFLNARGVNNDLSSFLHHYVWNKDKMEHIRCLNLLKSYVQTP